MADSGKASGFSKRMFRQAERHVGSKMRRRANPCQEEDDEAVGLVSFRQVQHCQEGEATASSETAFREVQRSQRGDEAAASSGSPCRM